MNCDRIARWYRWLEYLSFGRALERRRREYLTKLDDARNTLILGDGDGRFTAEFMRFNQRSRVESIDLSSRMLELAEARTTGSAQHHARVVFRRADARNVELTGKYDLIITHFFLDCFQDRELEHVIARVSESAQAQARWVVSEFQLPSHGISRLAARVLTRAMYLFFRATTGLKTTCLPDYATLLTMHGFYLIDRHQRAGGLLVSELWQKV